MTNNTEMHGKKTQLPSTQDHLPIGEIHDGVVVLKNGGIRQILKVQAVNFGLKSEQEQHALVVGYQSFLNTLDFPIQVVTRSKKLDIDGYLTKVSGIAKQQEKPILKKLLHEYGDFIKQLVDVADIMEKQFYVVVPYDPIRARDRGMISVFMDAFKTQDEASVIKQRHYEFDALKKALSPRVDSVMSGLVSMGLKVSVLDTAELIELYYQSFNKELAPSQKLDHLSDQSVLQV